MAATPMLEVREARGPFGRFCYWAFWLFQLACLLLTLGTCAFVAPYLQNDDPDVVLGAGMFGALTLGTLWLLWPTGTVALGLLALLTRGRKRLIPAAAAMPPRGSVPPTGRG